MSAIFLAFSPPSEAQMLLALEPGAVGLPNQIQHGELRLSPWGVGDKLIKIEVHDHCVALTNYGEDVCTLLDEKNRTLVVPPSTAEHSFTVLLRDSDQFITVAGRWAVMWDDLTGSLLQYSMRPPPLPVAPIDHQELTPMCTVPKREEDPDDRCMTNVRGAAAHATLKITDEADANDNSAAVASRPSPLTCADDDHISDRFEKDTGTFSSSIPSGKHDSRGLSEDTAHLQSANEKERFLSATANGRTSVSESPSSVKTHGPVVYDRSTFQQSSHISPAERKGHAVAVELQDDLTLTKHHLPDDSPGSVAPGQRAPDHTSSSNVISPVTSWKRRSPTSSGHGNKKRHKLTAHSPNGATADAAPVLAFDTNTITDAPKQPPFTPSSRESLQWASNGTGASPMPCEKNGHRRSSSSLSSATVEAISTGPVVYMAGTTTIDKRRNVMRSFAKLGGQTTKNIIEATVLCIPDPPLTRTGSLLLSICRGTQIVTEAWIADAHRKQQFPEPSRYLPKDRDKEKEWKFNLKDAVERGRAGLTHVLQGQTVHMTKRFQQSLTNKLVQELSMVATALGAEDVKRHIPSRKIMAEQDPGNVMVIGHDADPETSNVTKMGISLYHKDVLTMAVLRGQLERSEFVLASTLKSEPE